MHLIKQVEVFLMWLGMQIQRQDISFVSMDKSL
jgi:hypothetical protein